MTNKVLSNLKLTDEPQIQSIRNEFAQYFEEAEFFFPILEKQILYLQPKTVAEIGSGIGLLAMAVSQSVDSVTGYEPSSAGYENVAEAHVQLRQSAKHSANFKRSLFSKEDGRFDLIYAINVIEHIPHWQTVVEEALESLTPGGKLILVFPNYTIPYEPNYNLLPLGGKRFTRIIFGKRIKTSRIQNTEQHWNDLSFPKYRQLKKLIAQKTRFTAEFSNEVVLSYVARLDRDAEFDKRKKGLFFKLLRVAKKIGFLGYLVKNLPKPLHPVTFAVISNNQSEGFD